MTLLAAFLALFCAVVAAVVVTMLATSLLFEVMNARYPERRIQKDRVNRRKWVEFRQAPISILTLSACFAFGLFAQWQHWAMAPIELNWWSGAPAGRPPWPLASTAFHDQNHGHFRYNYGHSFSLRDRRKGTLHPRYDETLAHFEGSAAEPGDRSRSGPETP